MTLGEIIKKKRTENNWSLQYLAEKINYTKSTLSRIERGKVNPSFDRTIEILQLLNISLNDFINNEIKEDNKIINTKYGEVRIIENEDNSITVTYNTEKNVLVDMRSSNQIRFITVEPYTNKILSK